MKQEQPQVRFFRAFARQCDGIKSLGMCRREVFGVDQPYRRTQQEVGSDYKSSSHQAGRPKPGAGESAYHRATPQSRRRVESVHVDSLAQNRAGTQKADPGDYLRRDPRGVSSPTIAENTTKPHEPRATNALVRKPAIF
jgi:hypothetical protein